MSYYCFCCSVTKSSMRDLMLWFRCSDCDQSFGSTHSLPHDTGTESAMERQHHWQAARGSTCRWMGKQNKVRAQGKAAANPLLQASHCSLVKSFHASKTPNLPPLQYLLTLLLILFYWVSKPKDFLYVFISKDLSLPKKKNTDGYKHYNSLLFVIFYFVCNGDWAKKADMQWSRPSIPVNGPVKG